MFNINDKVVIVEAQVEVVKGCTAIVKKILQPNETGNDKVVYALEVDFPDDEVSHDCNGIVAIGKGWYAFDDDIKLARPELLCRMYEFDKELYDNLQIEIKTQGKLVIFKQDGKVKFMYNKTNNNVLKNNVTSEDDSKALSFALEKANILPMHYFIGGVLKVYTNEEFEAMYAELDKKEIKIEEEVPESNIVEVVQEQVKTPEPKVYKSVEEIEKEFLGK